MEVVSNALKILVVEDSVDDFDIFASCLKGQGYQLTLARVDTESAMREALETKEWNLVVSDFSMPHFSCLQALSVLKEIRRDLPFIVLSGTIDEDTAVEVMRAGAQDYIMKGNVRRLLPAIERELKDYRKKKSLESDLSIKSEQLLHAQKMEAIGNLAGGLAHDFNNLLAAIILNCQDAMETITVNDVACAALDQIELAAEQATALTRQLLAFTRKQASEVKTVNVARLVARQVKLLSRVIGARIEISTQFAERLPCVRIDPGQLEQAILNLTINARDAMADSGKLFLSGEEKVFSHDTPVESGILKAGRYLVFSARDTGMGMTMATRSRIFEPFFTTKPPGKGTGLGLSTVYGVATNAGGAIGVESELGKGSTFNIYLPAIDDIAEPEVESGSAKTDSLSAGTILLVEDRSDLRNLLQIMLTRRGYTVLAPECGAEALKIFGESPEKIDLLISAFTVAGLENGELVKIIREKSPGLPVIFTTADSDGDLPLAEKTDYLRKPFLFKEFLEKIRSVLEC